MINTIFSIIKLVLMHTYFRINFTRIVLEYHIVDVIVVLVFAHVSTRPSCFLSKRPDDAFLLLNDLITLT